MQKAREETGNNLKQKNEIYQDHAADSVKNVSETWKEGVPRTTLYSDIFGVSYLNSNCNGLNCVPSQFVLEGG